MHHRIKGVLQVDPLRQAVGGHQNRDFLVGDLGFQLLDAQDAFFWWQITGDRRHHVAALWQCLFELLGEVVRRRPEAAEDHRAKAFLEQGIQLLDQLLELGVVCLAAQEIGSSDQILEVLRVFCNGQISTGCCFLSAESLVGSIQHRQGSHGFQVGGNLVVIAVAITAGTGLQVEQLCSQRGGCRCRTAAHAAQ